MSHYRELSSQARAAYNAGRHAEAALLYRRAADAALEIGDRAAWFACTYWAAAATCYHGDHPAALALLLTARQQEPEDAPEYEAWLARKLMFDIVLATSPRRQRLEEILADLRDYAASHSVPDGDVPFMEGDLARYRCDWATALTHFESGWRQYDGHGAAKDAHAYMAAICCLQLNLFVATRNWITAVADCAQTPDPTAAFRQAELELRLALAVASPANELTSLLRTLIDRAYQFQRDDIPENVRKYIIRVRLIDTLDIDPSNPFHPARQELRRRTLARNNADFHFHAQLLLSDYRLACLRHAAGIVPVDDLYYRHAQQVPPHITPSDPDDFRRRLQKARAAAGYALQSARRLDEMLECDYRQKDVAARQSRIEQIAQAAGQHEA